MSGLTLAGGSVAASLSATVTDAETTPFTHQWSVTSGNVSEVSFASSTDEDTDVTFRAAGDYTLQFVATDVDDTSSTGSATVSVTVSEADGGDPPANESPEADAGDDQEVSVGEEVALDSSGSSDPDGDNLNYAWEFTSQPEGSSATLADTESPTFTPDVAGDYTAQLTVTDGNGGSDTDSVTVSAEAEDQPPGDPDPPANTAPRVSIEDVTDLTLENGSATASL